nr:ABC transporter substrate-binding protein [Ruegeria sp. PR1b]
MTRFRSSVTAAIFALSLTPTITTAQSVSIIDDSGSVISVEETARIASVSYFGADVALALGITPVATTYMVEGRDPAFLGGGLEGVAQIGQRASPNIELLAAAQPDLVVAIRRYTEAVADEIRGFSTLLSYDLELFSDSDRKILELGTLLGMADEAQALNAQFRDDLAAYVEQAPADGPRFAVMWGGEVPWVFRTENMTASILNTLGGENVAGHNPTPHIRDNWGVEMSLEALLEADPEVIFIYDYGPDRPHEDNPIWSNLSAVQNDRVHYIGDHWVETHGPLGRQMVLREAAHMLYPDTFPAVDVRAEAAAMIEVAQ